MRNGEQGAICECPVCGKPFWASAPELWVYRIGQRKACSWTCLRRAEKTGLQRRVQHQVHNPPQDYTPPEHWYRMREMRDQGMPHREIARQFGIRETSVGSIISKLNKYDLINGIRHEPTEVKHDD